MKWLLWKLGLVDCVWVLKCYPPKGSYLALVRLDTETGERFIIHCGDLEKLNTGGNIATHSMDRFRYINYSGFFSRPTAGLTMWSGLKRHRPVKVYNGLTEK